jgi:hypothetical protein
VSGKRPGRRLFVALVALFLLAFISSGTWIFFARPLGPTASDSIVGHAFFISSGQVNPTSAQGICDQLEIDLNPIAPPASGKAYYAWLLGDRNQQQFRAQLLGTIVVNAKSAHFVYPGDVKHSNLIASMSRLLITEEDARTTPTQPSSDNHLWRYYAELPQQLDSIGKNRRVIYFLRQLLYGGGGKGIPGGVDNHVFRTAQEVLHLAKGANDAWHSSNTHLLREQIMRILVDLDGASSVDQDVQSASLIGNESAVTPSSLLNMDKSIVGLINTPGLTSERQKLAKKIDTAITQNIFGWLQHVRQDARTLMGMSDKQLVQPSAQRLLNDMVTQADYSLNGDSASGQGQEGISWIHKSITSLATFDLTTQLPKSL